jgi:hypothetical protein
MARTVSRRATGTTLVWGRMPPVPVDLFKTTKAQPEADFETRWVGEVEAGPVELDTRPEPVVPEPSAPPTDPLAEELPRPGEMTPEALAEAFDIPPAEVEAPRPEKRKGLTIDDRWLDLTENLDAITDATRLEEMRVIGFVPSPSVPRVLVTGSYYLGSGGPGAPKVLRALEEGMRAHHAVAVVKWTKTSRQALGVIVASKKAMYVLELAWAGDLLPAGPRAPGGGADGRGAAARRGSRARDDGRSGRDRGAGGRRRGHAEAAPGGRGGGPRRRLGGPERGAYGGGDREPRGGIGGVLGGGGG